MSRQYSALILIFDLFPKNEELVLQFLTSRKWIKLSNYFLVSNWCFVSKGEAKGLLLIAYCENERNYSVLNRKSIVDGLIRNSSDYRDTFAVTELSSSSRTLYV